MKVRPPEFLTRDKEVLTKILNDLWQLFGNVTAHENSLQVDPQVLHGHPVLNHLVGVGKVGHPQLNLLLEGRVVPESAKTYMHQTKALIHYQDLTHAKCNAVAIATDRIRRPE